MSSADSSFSLDLAGVVALAEISVITERTALTGGSALLDIFILAPGLHRQQNATEVNEGEYPATAAMTTGYVFRVENPATVYFLKKVGRTGELTTISIKRAQRKTPASKHRGLSLLFASDTATSVGIVAYSVAVGSTFTVLSLLVYTRDWWGLLVMIFLIFNRLINFLLIRSRSHVEWRGASEDGDGDLLVLLSQDRWIRIVGAVNDLKAVTSGEWLREMTWVESTVSGFATLLVYINATLASNAKQSGKILLVLLLFGTAALLALVNNSTRSFQMHGNIGIVQEPRRKFRRRLDLAEALIKETGRADWALRLGMINSIPDDATVNSAWGTAAGIQQGVTM